jgi:tetratricopeptide (TPR) repeat protein
MLAPEVRAELRSLSRHQADSVACHLVAAGQLVDSDPERALQHAREARRMAARIGAVREAVGITAYHASEWAEALTELRAARRLTGDASHLPLMADCERAMGRPERALRVAQSADASRLDAAGRVELRMVEAGARRDLGELDAALMILQGAGLDRSRLLPWSVRLWYAYADTLVAAGRLDEAQEWFLAVAGIDADDQTDAEDRLVELGVLEPVGDPDEPGIDMAEAGVEADVEGGDAVIPVGYEAGVYLPARGVGDAAVPGGEFVEAEIEIAQDEIAHDGDAQDGDAVTPGGGQSGHDPAGATVGAEAEDSAVPAGEQPGIDFVEAETGAERGEGNESVPDDTVAPSRREPAIGLALFQEPPSDPEPSNLPEPTDNSPD